jgi:TPP-dependent pyruvate/acetoin dehydrogenase alpha subunit
MAVAKEKLIEMYRVMVRIRTFEERVAKLFAVGKIPGAAHLYAGEEAVATGAPTLVTACPACSRAITMARTAAKAPLD